MKTQVWNTANDKILRRLRTMSAMALFILSINTSILAQCNVDIDKSISSTVVYKYASEELYRNTDLEHGLNVVRANFILMAQKTDPKMIKFYLTVTHAKSLYQPAVIPRKIKFHFSPKDSLVINAEDQDSPVISQGVELNTCYFRVRLEDIEKLKSHSVIGFLITDTRTGQMILTSPYKDIFSEQIACLYKRSQ